MQFPGFLESSGVAAVSTPGPLQLLGGFIRPLLCKSRRGTQVPAAGPLSAAVCPAGHSALTRLRVHRLDRPNELARSWGSWLPELCWPHRQHTS